MPKESIEVIAARIDERTNHIQSDVSEIKDKCHSLEKVVNIHSEKLARIDEQTKTNTQRIEEVKKKVNNNGGLSKKQKAGVGAFFASFIAAIIAAFWELFSRKG